MSAFSTVPYGKILDYWYEKLSHNPHLTKFLLTKIIEIIAFHWHKRTRRDQFFQYVEFSQPTANDILENPVVSVVVPTYIKNQKNINDINNLLRSISKQTRKPNGVVVVDDCSPILYPFSEHIHVYRQVKNFGPAKARNLGKMIALANKSDIIAFTDTDCILSENWIETIVKAFQCSKEFQILSGNTVSYDKNWFGTYHNINGTLNGRKIQNTERLLYGTTANLAITRCVAESINFSENFPLAAGEDMEFCFRANQNNFAIKYIPQMVVFHNYGYSGNIWKNLISFIRQFKRYGQGETILLKEIPEYYAYFDKTEEITTTI